jgi:hypothetical protein
MNNPTKLERLTRTNHEDTYVIINRLVDVINALSDRLHVIESELAAQRGSDARQAHKRDKRVAKPL